MATAFNISLYHFSKFLDSCNRHSSILLSCVGDVLILFYFPCYNFQLLQSLGTIKGSYSEICQESKSKVSKRQTSDTGNMYSYIVIIAFTVAFYAVFILHIILYMSNYSRILIGSNLWSIVKQMHRWRHWQLFCFFIISNKHIPCLPCVWSIIDLRRLQNVVKSISDTPAIALFSTFSYHMLTSSVIK